MKRGILLINLGTPEDCNVTCVSSYLREFLNDPRVIDLPTVARWILVNLIIIPFRVKKTTGAYQKIWLGAGSPLLVHSLLLKQALEEALGETYHVEFGMRYGKPSIKTALHKLKSCSHLTILPLFPQYSSAATGSAMENVLTLIGKQWNIPTLMMKKDFYAEPEFIAAYAAVIRESLANKKIDRVIFSYHGLPERHIQKSECRATCEKLGACPEISDLNAYCYRAQCYATSRLLADALSLELNDYCVAFQSRLGRTPWIKPYTDLILPKLIEKGVKRIAVVCPSFVSDCLETLEEVDIRMREQWLAMGGEEFTCVSCLNADPHWVVGLKRIIERLNV